MQKANWQEPISKAAKEETGEAQKYKNMATILSACIYYYYYLLLLLAWLLSWSGDSRL